jgi:hypothetical protein
MCKGLNKIQLRGLIWGSCTNRCYGFWIVNYIIIVKYSLCPKLLEYFDWKTNIKESVRNLWKCPTSSFEQTFKWAILHPKYSCQYFHKIEIWKQCNRKQSSFYLKSTELWMINNWPLTLCTSLLVSSSYNTRKTS